MPAFPSAFLDLNGIPQTHGIAAAGRALYLPADVPLTASLVQQFGVPILPNVAYDFDAQLILEVTGAGIVTSNVGATAGTNLVRLIQQAQTTATAVEQKCLIGSGGSTSVASSSIGTGDRSVVLRGSLLGTAEGTLFLRLSTGGTMNIRAGSTFRVFRTE